MKYEDFTDNPNNIEEPCEECEPFEEELEEEDVEERTGRRRRIEVEEVLGIGSAEATVEACIPINPPAFEILDNLIKKTVVFDTLVALCGKVFVNARIVKNIPFKTRVKTLAPVCRNISRITFGDLRHVTVEVPVTLCIDIPESVKGAKVVVLDSRVDSVEIPNFISNRCKLIKSITEKDCVFVKVKVVEDRIICV